MGSARNIFAAALLLLLSGAASVQAQAPSTLRLSIEDALDRAREQNFRIRSAAAEAEAARAGKRQTLATFLPQLTVSEEGVATNDPLNTFGFRLKQESVTQADFAPSVLNDPDRVDNFTTKVEVRQPILNLDGLYQRRAAADQARAADLGQQRTEAFVTFKVREGYYGLVLAQQRRAVIDSALTAAHANRDQAQNFYEQGMINRADLLAAEVRVLELESQRTDAQARVQNAADQLRYLLGLEERIAIEPTDDLRVMMAPVDTVDVGQVNQQRSDMRALRFQADAAQEQLRAKRSAFLPKLNAFGGYEWNDEVPFGTQGESWIAGASLSWNVFSGFKNAGAAQRARADLRRAELAVRDQALQNEVQITAALRNLEASRQQLRQAEAAVEQARESLRIRSDRFEQGLEKTTDVLNAEVTLANKRLAYLKTLYDHNMNIYRLELLTERSLAR